jgi:hypothetical protein
MIERFFGRHLFAAAFVLAVFVLAVAGAAARSEHFLAYHGNNRMVGGAFATRTMVVNVVAKSHKGSFMAIVLPILPQSGFAVSGFMIKSLSCLFHSAANSLRLKAWMAWASPRNWRTWPRTCASAALT